MKKSKNFRTSAGPAKGAKNSGPKDSTRSNFSAKKSTYSEGKKGAYVDKKYSPKAGARPFVKDTERDEKPKGKAFADKKPKTYVPRDKEGFSKEYAKPTGEKPAYKKDPFSKAAKAPQKFVAGGGRQKRSSDLDRRSPKSDFGAKDSYKEKKDKPFAKDAASEKVYDVEANKKRYDSIGKRNRTAAPKSFNPNFKTNTKAPSRPKATMDEEMPAVSKAAAKPVKLPKVSNIVAAEETLDPNTMRLNRYLAHCGIASRRKADELIEQGKVKLNGKVVTEPGCKWNKGDVVSFEGKRVEPQQLVYILLNKPKNTITTNSDEKGRKTVFDHIDEKLAKLGLIDLRLFTVGRLDRNSLGVLLITNDGDLAQELTHPSKEVEKIYQVQLDKNVSPEDMEKLATGVTLEDGFIHCDKIAYVHELAKDEVGVEIHSGKNRIVRRMFDHLGYNVIKLDRVSFAGLTKKDLPRGKWRFLKDNEVRQLKHFNKQKPTKKSPRK